MSRYVPSDPVAAFFGEAIHVYTRAEAIADGVLVDVSEVAAEVGFRWPVAMTAGAWADVVAWSDEDSRRQVHQDQSGRLRDVLVSAMVVIHTQRAACAWLRFPVCRVPRDGRSTVPRTTPLKLVAGPGDDAEPVVTILLPHED